MRHRHIRGSQQEPSSILPLVTLLMSHRPAAVTEVQHAAGDEPKADTELQRTRNKRLRLITAGATVASLPAGSAVGWAIAGHLGVILALAIVAVATAAAAM